MCRSETHDQSRNFDAFDFFQFWIITTVFQVISKFRGVGVIVLQTPSVYGESVTPHSGIFGVPRARPARENRYPQARGFSLAAAAAASAGC